MKEYCLVFILCFTGCALTQKADVNYDSTKIKTGMILSLDFPQTLASQDCSLSIRGTRHRYTVNFAEIQTHPIFIGMEPDIYNFDKINCSPLEMLLVDEYSIGASFLHNLSIVQNSISVVLPTMIQRSERGHLLIMQDRTFQKRAIDKLYQVSTENEKLISAHNGSVIERSFFRDGSQTPGVEVLMNKAGVDLRPYSEMAMNCYEQEVTTNILPLGRESIKWSRNSQTVTVASLNSKKRLNNYSQKYIDCVQTVIKSAKNDPRVQTITIDF